MASTRNVETRRTAATAPLAVLYLVGLAVALAVPFFALFTSARLVISSEWLYDWGFQSFQISGLTGITPDQLKRASADIVTYFVDSRPRLDTVVERNGAPYVLFNEREVLHMVDVKGLVQLVYGLQLAAAAVLAVATAAAVIWRGLTRAVAVGVLGGVASTALLAGAAAVLAGLDFESVFLQFHLLSFSNDLWLLDPRTDNLIRLFPQEFFLGSVFAIGGVTVLLCALLGGGAWAVLRAAAPRSTG